MKKRAVRKIAGFLANYWRESLVLFGLIFIINLASLATPYVLKIIIDDLVPNKNYPKLIAILAGLVAIYVVRIGFTYLLDVRYTQVTQRIVADLRATIMENVLRKPLTFFQEKQVGDTIFLLSNDVNNVQYSLSFLVNDILNNLILIVSIVFIMLTINIQLTLISLLAVPLIVFVSAKLAPKIQDKFKKVQEVESKLFSYFTDELKNIKLIKLLKTYDHEQERIGQFHNTIIDLHSNNTRLNSLNKNCITFVVALIPVIILGVGGKQVMNETITIGALIAYIQYVNRLLPPVTSISNGYNAAIKSFVSMNRISSFIDSHENTSPKTTRKKEISRVHKLSLENVSFTYGDRQVLNAVNLTFESGKTYLITGESGSGKSTLINLLCHIHQPTEGKILVETVETAKEAQTIQVPYRDISNINSLVFLVEKENQIFSDTIQNNVDYGTFTNDEHQIRQAIQSVNLLSKVESLEKGMRTELNSTISIFSEGQKQRIALARLFLRQFPIIIIDEATACVDIRNERSILEKLRHYNPDCILIVVTHRFSFDDLCDGFLEVHEGHVTQRHIHNKLALCE